MYFNRTRTFQLLLATFVLSVALFATLFTKPALAQGKLITDTITSPSLEGNLLGDSATRNMTIYLPPSYDTSDMRYPVAYYLPGWGNVTFNPAWDDPFVSSDDVPEGGLDGMFDDMIAAGDMIEMIIVVPEGNNKYGGAMYTNSDVTGNHEDYIVQDVVSYIDAHYRTIPSRDSRAIGGNSMGGYGAMKLAMKHPDVFGAVAAHGAFLYFEGLKPIVLSTIEENPDGITGPSADKIATSMAYAASAAFSPNADNPPFYVDLPFEYPVPEIIGEVWDRWLEHDPFTTLPIYGDNLASLRGIYFEAGDKDDYGFNYHADAFHQALDAVGIEHEYVIFDGGHSDTFYDRLPFSLSFLSDKLVSDADLAANKIVRRRLYEEVWNQGNLDVVDEIYAAEHTYGIYGSAEGFKQYVMITRAAFPDLHITINDEVAEGDMVATRVTAAGTHTGEFMGIPPTGVVGARTGIAIARVVDGKINMVWENHDELGMMQMLGVITPGRPSPENYAWGAPSEVTGDSGDPETNKAFVIDSIERVWNQHNLNAVDETFSPDFVAHTPVEINSPWVGTEVTKEVVTAYLTTFPDLHTTNDVVFAAADKVVVHWTTTATHDGELMGIPPTGKRVTFTGTTIYRMADGKIVENWWAWDALGLMQQLISPPVPNTEANKALVRRRYNEIWNQKNLAVADEILSDNYVYHDPDSDLDRDGRKQLVAMSLAAFPDSQWTVEAQVAEGDMVATRLTSIGTHQGEFMGLPPTGKQVTMTSITLDRVADGKIVETWTVYDKMGLVKQLGVMPSDSNDFSWGELSEVTGDPGDPEANKAISGRVFEEMWNQGDPDVIDEIYSPDYVGHVVGSPELHGTEGVKQIVTLYRTALPDLHFSVEFKIAEGDKVFTYWKNKGTHNGELMGIPPTGVEGGVAGIDIHRIADGKIVEAWGIFDNYGFMQQLGVIPKTGPEDFSNVFFMALTPGLNMISLPLKSQTPFTARSFVEKLSATVVIKLDEASKRFVGFTLDAPDDGFAIEGGKGYIVNVPEGGMVAFTGAAWTRPPMPAPEVRDFDRLAQTDGAWAFAVSGRFIDDSDDSLKRDGYLVSIRNTRTNVVATDVVRSGYFAAAFADLTRNNVVQRGDRLELQVRNQAGEIVSDTIHYTVTAESIHQAFISLALKNIEIPHQSLLLQNYPNPFNPETWIPYQIQESAEVFIRIYSASGQLVRTLNLGERTAGFYLGRSRSAYWDGHNDAGEMVASGIYFYQLRAGVFSATRRMLIVK